MTTKKQPGATPAQSHSSAAERRSRHPAHMPPLESSVVDSGAQPQFTEARAVLEAVEDQRQKLYRVSGTLRCIADALNAVSPHEDAAAGAIELAADEVDRVNAALDRVNLAKAAKEQQARVEDARAASEAAREAQS
jgi:hypothetical protein